MSPDQVASILDEASRVVPVKTPILALFAACLAAASLVLHAYAAYRASKQPKDDVRLPPPELKK